MLHKVFIHEATKGAQVAYHDDKSKADVELRFEGHVSKVPRSIHSLHDESPAVLRPGPTAENHNAIDTRVPCFDAGADLLDFVQKQEDTAHLGDKVVTGIPVPQL